MRFWSTFISSYFLTLAVGLGPGYAQVSNTSILSGLVIDALSLRPLAGAEVVLTEQGEMLEQTHTNALGRYAFTISSEGLFTLSIRISGYGPATEQNVRAVADKVTVTDFSLTPVAYNFEEITVMGAAKDADPFAAVTATRISREDIRTAPGTGGDIFRGLDSLPGVVATGEFSNFTVRGRGPRDNLILVDGIPFDKVVHFDQTLGEDEDIGGGGRFAIFAPNIIGGASFEPSGWSAAYSGKNGSLLKLDIAQGNPSTMTISGRLDIAGGEVTYDGPSYVASNTSLLISARYFDFGNVFIS